MRSRRYVLYLVLGSAAVALWFAAPSTKGPTDHRADPATAASSSPTVSVDVTAPPGGPTPLAVAPPLAPGVPVPTGTAPVATSTARAATANAPSLPPNPGEPGAPDQAAQIAVERVRHMVGDYHTLMGENPVGTNAEIMKQIMGGNSHQATLGPPEGMSLNAQGELVDPWGTPYFFHQLSRDRMEVHSAGPDKVMGTADDIVTR